MTTLQFNDGYRSYLPGPGYAYRPGPEATRIPANPPTTTKEKQIRFNPERLFIAFGTLVLLIICAIPVANAAALLDDFNFIFWAGREIPMWLVTLSTIIIVLYMITGYLFFSYAKQESRSEQAIMMIAHTFITMLGLIFMMVALSLTHKTAATYNNLHRQCHFSEDTHKVFEFSQVLHALRSQPGCIEKYSIESCEGYQDAPPYTTYLKDLEENFRCSGFCYVPPGTALDTSPALLSMSVSTHRRGSAYHPTLISSLQHLSIDSTHGVSPSTNIEAKELDEEEGISVRTKRRRKEDGGMAAEDSATKNATAVSATGNATAATQPELSVRSDAYPPALFSNSKFQFSCDGTAARDMRDFAGDMGNQLWYQGLYLVTISIGTGFLKLFGFCTKIHFPLGRKFYLKHMGM